MFWFQCSHERQRVSGHGYAGARPRFGEVAIAAQIFRPNLPRMTKLAEIQTAILRLSRDDRAELLHWLVESESPEMLAAVDEADRSFEAEGGMPPEEVRKNLRKWAGG